MAMGALVACAPLGPQERMARADQAQSVQRYGKARANYARYLKQYRGGERAGEARLKIGLGHFEREKWLLAINSFGDVLEKHSKSEQIWDALYYGGIAYAKLGRCVEATAWLGKLTQAITVGAAGSERYVSKAESQLAVIHDDMLGRHKFCSVHTGST